MGLLQIVSALLCARLALCCVPINYRRPLRPFNLTLELPPTLRSLQEQVNQLATVVDELTDIVTEGAALYTALQAQVAINTAAVEGVCSSDRCDFIRDRIVAINTRLSDDVTALDTDITTIKACMADNEDATCTATYSGSSSMPQKLTNMDSCMADIDDATCSASYGASLVPSGGSGMVAWIQQFKKPAILRCGLGNSVVSYTDEDTTPIAEGCNTFAQYYRMVFAECSHSEPDASSPYHIMPKNTGTDATADVNEVYIGTEGWYDISISALMEIDDNNKRIDVEIYRVSSLDPASSCAATGSGSMCEALLTAEGKFDVFGITGSEDRRTLSQQGTMRLCAGDQLIAFVSKNGNVGNNPTTTILGVAAGHESILSITKVYHA